MNLIYFGLYTLLLVFVWGFFIVAKLHTYKFRNFSKNISPITSFLLIFLLILSILGYVCIFFLGGKISGKATLPEIENIGKNGKTFEDLDLKEVNY